MLLHHSSRDMWVVDCTLVMLVCAPLPDVSLVVSLCIIVGYHNQIYLCSRWIIYQWSFFFLWIFSGENWMKSMFLTASLFPFLCFGIGFILNTIAIFYGSIAAIPLGTIVVVLVIWAFISLPLSLLGTVVGRNWSGTPNNPCRVKNIPRPIPEKKWYLRPYVISLVGGLLPFASIFTEMYYIFASFWTYMVITLFGI